MNAIYASLKRHDWTVLYDIQAVMADTVYLLKLSTVCAIHPIPMRNTSIENHETIVGKPQRLCLYASTYGIFLAL